MSSDYTHQARIQQQFSRQASTFASVPSHSSDRSLQALLELAEPRESDQALDVACGPGIVSCAFSPCVAHLHGQDVVPQMIERARARQAELGLSNLSFDTCDSSALPYADGGIFAPVA